MNHVMMSLKILLRSSFEITLRAMNQYTQVYNLDVMINLTSPGDEELECVVGEKSGQLESENHPWVSRNVVLFQIP